MRATEQNNDVLTIRGVLTITEIEAPKTPWQRFLKKMGLWQGRVISVSEHKNLVVNTGKNHIAALIAGEAPNVMTHMAIGNGDGNGGALPPSSDQTQLQNELARSAATVTRGTGSNANKVTWEATFSASTGRDKITEMGIFNAASGGTMLSRVVFSPAKDNQNNDLNLKYELTVGS